jgi:hypothetical protein
MKETLAALGLGSIFIMLFLLLPAYFIFVPYVFGWITHYYLYFLKVPTWLLGFGELIVLSVVSSVVRG